MLKFVYNIVGYDVYNEKDEMVADSVPPSVVFEYLCTLNSKESYSFKLGNGVILVKDNFSTLILYVFSKGRMIDIQLDPLYNADKYKMYIPDVVTKIVLSRDKEFYNFVNAYVVVVQKQTNQIYDIDNLITEMSSISYPYPPLPNIYCDGKICFGNINIPKIEVPLMYNSDFIYNYYFRSLFNSDLFSTSIVNSFDFKGFSISSDLKDYFKQISHMSINNTQRYLDFIHSSMNKIVI